MAAKLIDGKASLEVRALSRRVLGWRKRRNWTLEELKEIVGFSTAKLSQLSSAVIRCSPMDVVKIASACGVPDDEVELCVQASHRLGDPQTWDYVTRGAWPRLTWTYWDVAAEASELVIVAADAIPELVRTAAHHAAMLQAGATAHELDSKLREEILSRLATGPRDAAQHGSAGPLLVRLIVSESVLTSNVGGARVVADQLLHLDELQESLPSLAIEVVDSAAGPYYGMGKSFTVMRFVERRFDDVVHVRAIHGDSWLEAERERQPYEHALESLGAVLRPREETSPWLCQTAMQLQDPLHNKRPKRSEGCRSAINRSGSTA
ncbi:Scr1 family TA system antitoxin-like transcriptional regulator [Lentzea sp. NPDC006480]|uniref:Scr1 family TA system antitoxin-like transcriptional regulator n=1 Tax=Lentzea sp. NPDC006480 TaxID=3157176 RepID=UPI0033A5BC69